MELKENPSIFASQLQKGRLADRLGNGLQNRAERFDSATDLYLIAETSEVLRSEVFSLENKEKSKHSPNLQQKILLLQTDSIIFQLWPMKF